MNEGEARPLGLAETRATDGRHLALAQTHASLDSRQDPPRSFGAADTQVFGGDSQAPQEPQELVDIAARDTLESGLHGGLARPELAGREEHRRRDLLKAKLFGEAEAAVKIGRFQVLGRLGAGGMGIVYTAYDERLDRKVAIKVLRPESSGGQSRVRLLREAQAMARLSHPNIVGVHEVGEDGDSVFVAMEFVRGDSLDRWLEQRRPWRTVLEVFMAAGRGLQAAHAAGMIHRDFKPANAILADDGRVKVLDFGLARSGAAAIESAQSTAHPSEHSLMEVRLTRTGAMMGTPAYMSPEQLLGGELGPASDQFSFFVALYEGLYGALPFAGASLTELIASVTQGRPGDAPLNSDVPAWLRRVVVRGLAQEPSDRWPDMASALAALASDPSRRRRRLAALLGLVVASAGASAVAMQVVAPAGQCEGLAGATEQVWNDERIAAARGAFSTSALGAETWSLVEPRLMAWTDEWVALRGDRCEAQVTGRISDTLHDRSVACLDRQLARVDGLVGAFAHADATVVEQAPAAVAALPPLALCSDTDYLMAEVRPPEDPQARVQVAEGRASLERARAAIDLGDFAGGLRQATTVAVLGRTLDHEPLVALAEVVRGDALQWQREVAGAEAALSVGLELGLASGDDRAAAEAMARRIYVQAEFAGRSQQALGEAVIGRALLRRIGEDTRLAWLLENNIAVAHERAGQLDEAIRGYEAALGLAGERSYEAMVSLYNLGLLSGRLDRLDRADELFGAAVVTGEHLFGPRHPALLPLLEGQANAAYAMGRLGRARALCDRARGIHAGLPAPSPGLLLPIVELQAQLAMERREASAPALAAEASALALAATGPGSARGAFALLRSQVHQDARETDYTAALGQLAGVSPELWGEALLSRVTALLFAERPVRMLEVLDEARTSGPWGALKSDSRVPLGLVEAEVLIDLGRISEAVAVLDDIEERVDEGTSRWVRPRIDYHRGRIAALRGDFAAAVVDLRRAAESYATSFDGDHPEQLEVRFALARALRGAGSRGEAESVARPVLAAYVTLGPGFAVEVAAIEAWLAAG